MKKPANHAWIEAGSLQQPEEHEVKTRVEEALVVGDVAVEPVPVSVHPALRDLDHREVVVMHAIAAGEEGGEPVKNPGLCCGSMPPLLRVRPA